MKKYTLFIALLVVWQIAKAQRHCIVQCYEWVYNHPDWSAKMVDADNKGNFPDIVYSGDTLYILSQDNKLKRFVIDNTYVRSDNNINASGYVVDDDFVQTEGLFGLLCSPGQKLLDLTYCPDNLRQSLVKWFYKRNHSPAFEAGGDLSGSYPSPTIAASAVTMDKIAQAGADRGQVIKWIDGGWAPATDAQQELWRVREHFTECPLEDVYFKTIISGSGLSTTVSKDDYEIGMPCVVAFVSGAETSASIGSFSYCGNHDQPIWMGNGSKMRAKIKLPNFPPIGTDSLIFRVGFFPRTSVNINSKGCYFDYRYVHSAAQMRLNAVTSTGTTTTATQIFEHPIENVWVEFEILYSSENIVEFKINDTVVATHSTNLPNMLDTSVSTFPGFAWGKFAGTGTATYRILVDYLYWKK